MTAQTNRANFPFTAQIVDAFRKEFGEGIKLIYAEEGGKTIGKKPPEPKFFLTASQWLIGSESIINAEIFRAILKKKVRGKNECQDNVDGI